MTAFLPCASAPPLNAPGRRIKALCARRRLPHRAAARVLVSATTDEAPPVDGPPVDGPPPPMPPPRRPDPNAPPPPPSPSAFQPPPRDRPFQPRTDRPPRYDRAPRHDRGPRPQYGQRDDFRRGPPGSRPDRFDRERPPPKPFVADPDATYYAKCAVCRASYELKPEVILPRGKKVACAVCGNEWFQKLDRLIVLKENEAFKDYPLEQKEALMEEQNQARKARFRARKFEIESGLGPRGSATWREFEQREYVRRPPRAGHSQHSVFIGNLPFSCSLEQLEGLIGETVSANRVSIVTDANGRSKGYAFADLKSDDDVHTVVNALDGRQVDGRSLTVRVGRKN